MPKRHYSTHRMVCWRLSRHCNRACDFCLSRSGPKFRHPTHDPTEMMVRLKSLGVEKISYSGGEPLLYEGIEGLTGLGRQLGMLQTLTTNGDPLSATGIPRWLINFEYVNLSFYGDRSLHDSLMGHGHFDELTRIARQLMSVGISVGVNYMLTPDSLTTAPAFLRVCVALEIHDVQFQTYIRTNQIRVDRKYAPDDYAEMIRRLNDVVGPMAHRFPGLFKVHDYTKSDWFIVLTDQGYLTLPISGSVDFLMGHLSDANLRLPDKSVRAADAALAAIWERRLTTDAISLVQ